MQKHLYSIGYRQFTTYDQRYTEEENDDAYKPGDEDKMKHELKPYIHSFEQITSTNQHILPTPISLQEDFMGFENSVQYTLDRFYSFLTNASWVSFR